MIVTKAGSKNDPSDNTGLAHYLEHMLFKGTDKYGTLDFQKEKELLIQIEGLYEDYRKTVNPEQRKAIYRKIDSISVVASKYAIANEYDKMVAAIGAKGTNAFTSFDQTAYVNNIPSNQLDKWLTIESERFRNPVMRLFHTELEAVYEEKNRALDNDFRKVFESMFASLFQKHTYGTQTTIGTVAHLKNPSITKIKDYYRSYYIPNNMAICISGDIDYDQTIRMIDAAFGKMETRPLLPFNMQQEDPITKPIEKEVYGPDAEAVMVGYRIGGFNTEDADMLSLLSKLLYNGSAGLVDLNLLQPQMVLDAGVFPYLLKDYGALFLYGSAKEGQKLEEVRELMLAQIDKIASGDFPDWLMTAAITEFKLEKIKEAEDNDSRVNAFMEAFVNETPWTNYMTRNQRIAAISKEKMVAWVKKTFARNNYAVVYKRTAEDKTTEKVDKPAITPVEVNRDAQSPFLKAITAAPSSPVEPVFINYQKDIEKITLMGGVPLYYNQNKENSLFTMVYQWNMGSNHDPRMPLVAEYLNFVGTPQMNAAKVKEELYKLGCSLDFSAGQDVFNITLSGLSENFERALRITEDLLTSAVPDQKALDDLVVNTLKNRADAKLSKGTILMGGMMNYAGYGPNSPFRNILSEAELKALKANEICDIIKDLPKKKHEADYYGPMMSKALEESVNIIHATKGLTDIPAAKVFNQLPQTNTKVYVVDYDMKQAEILMVSRDTKYDATILPQTRIFNEYYGGTMGSVVFQTMRESKALAYSVYSSYSTTDRKEKYNNVVAYIGTQSDKLPEAMSGMMDLLNAMPESENMFKAAKDAVIQQIRTERITKAAKLSSYRRARKLGLELDVRQDIFNKVPNMTMKDVKAFHETHLKNRKYNIMVLGKKENLNLDELKKYGEVTFLSLNDLFGY
jgi:predicted Zn-dependent peptidase